MADKDRAKGPANHPESTVQEGVGSLKEDDKKRAAADKATTKTPQSSPKGS